MTAAGGWVCPSCLERIGPAEIGYRCGSGSGRCFGDTRLAAADPLAPAAVCGTCGRTAERRHCERCQERLPDGYLRERARTVVLAGPVGSGKSTLAATLMHELRHRLGEELGMALLPSDERTGAEVRDRYERPLYQDGRLLPATLPRTGFRPLVHRLTRAGRRRERALTLALLDTRGWQPTGTPASLVRADAVVLVLDPQLLPGPALDLVFEQVRAALAPQGERIRVPVATVLAKLDLTGPQLLPNSPLHLRRSPGPGFDPVDRAAVDAELRALLELRQAGALTRLLDELCADHQLFALSALGAAPCGGVLPPGGPRPHRVEDPLLWLLHRFGFVDCVRAGR